MEFEILVPGMEKETAKTILEYAITIFPGNQDVIRIATQIADAKYWEAYNSDAPNRQEYWRVVKNCLDVRTTSELTSLQAALSTRGKDAVEFAEWIANEDYKPGTGNERWYKWKGIECEAIPYTTDGLYRLFLKP